MCIRFLFTVLLLSLTAEAALAERVAFTRTFDVGQAPTLDVKTVRGKIAIRSGAPGRIVVHGLVTVRVGVDVPADALQIAQRIAADPPVRRTGDAVTLEAPADGRERRAVTVSYEVEVPATAGVTTASESGETSVTGIEGTLSVRTQSARLAVAGTRGDATIDTGSGAVTLDDVTGATRATTSSGSITATEVGGSLRVDTGSGAVEVDLTGHGMVQVRTQSSGVRLRGLSGGADVQTGSGRIIVALAADASVRLDSSTGSGSIDVRGVQVAGTVEKRHVAGTVGSGGDDVRLVSRSGSIRVTQ